MENDMEFTIKPTDDKLVYILRVNDIDIETIHLPQVCIFNSEDERLDILQRAAFNRLMKE